MTTLSRKSAPASLFLFACLGLSLSACKPAESPPDLLKTQREVLDKAKALDGQLQQQSAERMKAAEDVQK